MHATRWLREAIAEAISLVMVLQRAVVLGGFDPYALRRAMERASWATSSECVIRVRNRSPSWFRKTCVL